MLSPWSCQSPPLAVGVRTYTCRDLCQASPLIVGIWTCVSLIAILIVMLGPCMRGMKLVSFPSNLFQ
jgi:hypothetical protein